MEIIEKTTKESIVRLILFLGKQDFLQVNLKLIHYSSNEAIREVTSGHTHMHIALLE